MNCLRCGRTVPDQVLLCPECLSEKDKPVRAKIEPLQEELQKEQINKLRRKLRGLRRGLAIFVPVVAQGFAGASLISKSKETGSIIWPMVPSARIMAVILYSSASSKPRMTVKRSRYFSAAAAESATDFSKRGWQAISG